VEATGEQAYTWPTALNIAHAHIKHLTSSAVCKQHVSATQLRYWFMGTMEQQRVQKEEGQGA